MLFRLCGLPIVSIEKLLSRILWTKTFTGPGDMEFQQCFSLLATRPAHAHEHCEDEQETALANDVAVGGEGASPAEAAGDSDDLTQLDARALVQAFGRLQETRVQIYVAFRKCKTTQFPAFCADMTAQFAAVSDRINSVEKLLRDERAQLAIAQLVRKVQLEEKEKLLLVGRGRLLWTLSLTTSAVLIEKMRLGEAAKQAEPDAATVAFLERSVQTLTTKHTDCVMRINELLEDLRAESADLQDE
ncbi:hypothetical protein BBJ28_00018227 [Nothophytophthora sp. Chile5]|nr:hypothetical protein BBJ28_00018227 [Nothophytophthora sp. Chile5]